MRSEILRKRSVRQRRVRSKIIGTPVKPRASVFRSKKYTELQLIDDTTGRTVVRVSTREVKDAHNKTESAQRAGALLAQRAQEAGIHEVVFDRRHYKYHGRVKAAAEGMRSGGLKF